MFSGFGRDVEERRLAAAMLRTLSDAGCDTENEHELEMGLISYSSTMLALDQQRTTQRNGRPVEKPRAGRNDRCPCGSGKKYKKCCLDKDRPFPANGHPVAPFGFGPEVLPRLWNDGAVAEDCDMLLQIMARDPAFANVGFSREKISLFMDAVTKEDPSFMDDGDALARTIDELVFRYVLESGEAKITRGVKDKFRAAMTRAHSKAEMRALATGICFAMMSDRSEDPETNMLNVIFFRKALAEVAKAASLVDRVSDLLGCNDAEGLRRLMAANDPSVQEKIDSFVSSLPASEIAAMQAALEKSHEELWDTISAGEFPVPLPFATQLALFGRFASLAGSNEKPSADAMYEMIEAFSNELIEEDHILFGQMLDRWLKDCEKRSGRVARAVEAMAGLCAIRSIESYVPNLLIRGGRRGLLVPFDEEEKAFIDAGADRWDTPEFLAEYGAWLASKGYPGLANRLLTAKQSHANANSPDQFPLRKLNVG